MSSIVMWLVLILVQGDGVKAEVFQLEDECNERLAQIKVEKDTIGVTPCVRIQMDAVEKAKA